MKKKNLPLGHPDLIANCKLCKGTGSARWVDGYLAEGLREYREAHWVGCDRKDPEATACPGCRPYPKHASDPYS